MLLNYKILISGKNKYYKTESVIITHITLHKLTLDNDNINIQ